MRVVREQSSAPHAHLIELGHEQVHGGRTRVRGRKLNRLQRSIRGIQSKGRVEGRFMLKQSISEADTTFRRSVEKMLDSITKDIKA